MGYVRRSSTETVFFLAIPLLRDRTGLPSNHVNDQTNLHPPELPILAVDDNPTNLMILSRMLKDLGCMFETASSADEALGKLQRNQYSLALLDYELGDGMTGAMVLREMKQRGIPMPRFGVVAVSAHALADTRDECARVGFVSYLTKPFDAATLRNVLVRVMRDGESFQMTFAQ